MNNDLLIINPEKEVDRIVEFLKKTFKEQKISRAVIGLSGGIDSTVSLYLVKLALGPQNVDVLHLPYDSKISPDISLIISCAKIPKENFKIISIKKSVDVTASSLNIEKSDKVRFGNVAARIRMISLFDFAKKENALVVGTENKTEYLLSYFTRFGDEASDIEPIRHLYKTQVYRIAEFLKVPSEIIDKAPTAGLWAGQTDEREFGFTYDEADQVLVNYYDQKKTIEQILKLGFKNAKKIIDWSEKNQYKHKTPYAYKKI